MKAEQIRMLDDKQAIYLYKNIQPILLDLKPYYKSFALKMKSKMKPPQARAKEIKPVEYINM